MNFWNFNVLFMSSMDVKVEGFGALVNRLKQIADDKTKISEARIILRQIAKPTLEVARQLTPVSKGRASSNIARFKRQKRDKRLVSKIPGRLKKSIGLITSKNKNSPTILVGPRVKGAFSSYDKSGFYGAFVHDGHNIYRKGFKRERTGNRISKKKGENYLKRAQLRNSKGVTGRTEADPFLTNAYQRTEGKVTADAEKKFTAFVQRRLKKLS